MPCACGGRQATSTPSLLANASPARDTAEYEIEFTNGTTQRVRGKRMAEAVVAVSGGRYYPVEPATTS